MKKAVFLSLFLVGCGSDWIVPHRSLVPVSTPPPTVTSPPTSTPDSGSPVVVVDSGTPVVDSGTPTVDAGVDAGSPTLDAGSPPPVDAGTGTDGGCGGPPHTDGGTGTDGGYDCKNGYGWGDWHHCHCKRDESIYTCKGDDNEETYVGPLSTEEVK